MTLMAALSRWFAERDWDGLLARVDRDGEPRVAEARTRACGSHIERLGQSGAEGEGWTLQAYYRQSSRDGC